MTEEKVEKTYDFTKELDWFAYVDQKGKVWVELYEGDEEMNKYFWLFDQKGGIVYKFLGVYKAIGRINALAKANKSV